MSTEIGIKERVDAIKVGSSAYNYYMNTPLSELKTREEKLIKQELESRSLTVLSESDTTEDVDDTVPEDNNTAVTDDTVEPTQRTKLLIPHFSGENDLNAEQKFVRGTAIFAGSAASVGILTRLLDDVGYLTPITKYFNETLPDMFKEALEAVGKIPGSSFISTLFNMITMPIKGLWTVFSKSGEWLYNLLLKPAGQTISGIWNGLESLFSTIPGIKNLYNLVKQGTDYIVSQTATIINSWIYEQPVSTSNWWDNTMGTVKGWFGASTPTSGDVKGAVDSAADTLTSIQKYTATTVFLALTIIVVALIWKIARYFIKDDGEVVQDGAYWEEINIDESLEYNYLTGSLTPITKYGNMLSEDYNPFYNNLSLAFLTEATENTPRITSIITTGDQSVTALLSDSKFIKFMSDRNPELLRLFEKYKNDNKSQLISESDVSELPNEEDNSVMPVDNTDSNSVENGSTTSLFDSIINGFKKIGSITADSLNYVKDKIIEFKRKFTDSPHTLVRWIPTAVETALAALAIYYLWNTNKDSLIGKVKAGLYGTAGAALGTAAVANGIDAANSNENIEEESPSEAEIEQEAFVINQYIGALNVISEAMDDMKKNNMPKIKVDKVLDGFNGKSDKMSSQIIDRAKKVSVDLLNQDEFITFSKKYNPEALTILKKASKLK